MRAAEYMQCLLDEMLWSVQVLATVWIRFCQVRVVRVINPNYSTLAQRRVACGEHYGFTVALYTRGCGALRTYTTSLENSTHRRACPPTPTLSFPQVSESRRIFLGTLAASQHSLLLIPRGQSESAIAPACTGQIFLGAYARQLRPRTPCWFGPPPCVPSKHRPASGLLGWA